VFKIIAVMALVGHESVAMSQRYTPDHAAGAILGLAVSFLLGEGRHNKADCQSYKDKAEWIFIVFSGLRMLYRLN
jgi:hypothetical protein